MKRNLWIGALFLAVIALLGIGAVKFDKKAAVEAATVQAPRFEVDPLWPKPLPNHWMIGQTIGVSVDAQDHIWIIHRPGSLEPGELHAATNPPMAQCCAAAPPVLEFDQAGNLLRHWGGPARATTGRTPITASPSITKATSGSAATAGGNSRAAKPGEMNEGAAQRHGCLSG